MQNNLCRVTDYIPEIILFIEKLLQKGFAYRAHDGSVYFNIDYYENQKYFYGKFNTEGSLGEGTVSRIQEDSRKQVSRDFVLWKAASPQDLLVGASWSSPFGKGRPGWHIECSAMNQSVFGKHLDFHFGGHDLMYPHHENEIAQCDAFLHPYQTNMSPWCSFFAHSAHLHIRGEKMSKSLQNFISIREYMNQPHKSHDAADTFRIFCLLSHYRKISDFSEKKLSDCKPLLDRLLEFQFNLTRLIHQNTSNTISKWDSLDSEFCTKTNSILRNVLKYLETDLGTHQALDHILNAISSFYLYLAAKEQQQKASPNIQLLLDFQCNIQIIMSNLFGLSIFNQQNTEEGTASSKTFHEFVQLAVDLRSSIRMLLVDTTKLVSPEKVDSITKLDILQKLDRFREESAKYSIKIKDHSDKSSSWSSC